MPCDLGHMRYIHAVLQYYLKEFIVRGEYIYLKEMVNRTIYYLKIAIQADFAFTSKSLFRRLQCLGFKFS